MSQDEREDSPAHERYSRKRRLADEDDEAETPANKRQKRSVGIRLQKNRESAARSREKKARLFKEMQVQVSQLTEKNNQLTRTLALLTNQCENMNTIRDENRDLRDKLHKLELQIARTEADNQTLRTQYDIGDEVAVRRSELPPALPTDQSNSSGDDETKRQPAPQALPPIPTVQSTTSVALSAFPSAVSSFPQIGSSVPHLTRHQVSTGPHEDERVEELTQLLLQRNPTNGVCTTSVPSCLPVQLYTCPTNANMKAAPKYYNTMSNQDYNVPHSIGGQFAQFGHNSHATHVNHQGHQQSYEMPHFRAN